jgi:hypothetical protein
MRMARISCWVPALGLLPLLVASCSDPVPPASQGAAIISLSSPGTGTAVCNVQHPVIAPLPVAGSAAPSDTTKGTIAIDGENGNLVTCAVVPVAGWYAVNAHIHADAPAGKFADITIESLTIGEGQSGVTGIVSVLDDRTQNPFQSPASSPCTFSVSGGGLGVGPGKIWASVTCPGLLDRGSANGDMCKATGYFIFENCSQ